MNAIPAGKTTTFLLILSMTVMFFAGCADSGGSADAAGKAADAAGKAADAAGKDIQTNIFQDVSGGNAKSLIADTAGLVILDVRTPEEFAGGHLQNAVNIDYQGAAFLTEIGRLERNTAYLVYCRSGRRSGEAAKIMKEAGFTNVRNLAGGINQWQAEGGAIVQ